MSELKESTVPGSVYEHYKGDMYVYLHEISDHETGGTSVVFRDKYDKLWYRTLQDFFGTVNIDGKKLPKFRYTGQILPI